LVSQPHNISKLTIKPYLNNSIF